MTAPRTTVEMKRVTLLRCKWCGAIAAKRGSQFVVLVDGDATRDCADGGREVHHPEPIVFAPLDATRRAALEDAARLVCWRCEGGEEVKPPDPRGDYYHYYDDPCPASAIHAAIAAEADKGEEQR